MNAHLVVSISIAMVGVSLAIFFFLTGKRLGEGESFSIKFAATVSGEATDGGDSSMDSEVYFCTGPGNCKYYEQMYSDFNSDYDLPDFFALVGIDAGEGKVVLSELTLGWMFTFEDGALTACEGLGFGEDEDSDYDPIEEAMSMASSAELSSFDEGTVINMGSTSITIGAHDIGYDPDVKSATVMGLKMPTPEECGALSPLPTPDEDQGPSVDAADESTWVDFAEPVDPDAGSRRLEEGRQLWGSATASTSNELWYAAGGAYDGDAEGKFTPWATCTNDNARAQFFYKCDHRGCNMNLGFAGSDDAKDWLQNVQAWPGGSDWDYHNGFHSYYTMLEPCVTRYRYMLEGWGIKLDYIVGHSLGGAAATVYAQERGNGLKGVVTFGAPKTNQPWNGGTKLQGWRFVHADDPVPSNLCAVGCVMGPLHHVVSNTYQVYDQLECWNEQVARSEKQKRQSCSRSWWKFWCWFEWIWTTVYSWVQSCGYTKKIKSESVNFAHHHFSLVWAVYGALAKHSAYGDYPSVDL
ncbi:hypothetical protein TeGR_g8934 [Tetraparma gracilis]|uniref:Fungal lipase-type domain-containing protein n=1 Tax=Tetraparma gracilis TaxID=2962635 RepID=A0ABQ6M3Z3_9STRA|nr:hypothetical protein TeGR_g8934 [Tetraparma gracilis]